MNQRLDWVDIAKGASIFLVVIYHTSFYLHANDAIPDAVIKVNLILAYFRMPTFFLISGILAARATRLPWGNLFANKIATLIWLLLLWTLIRYAFFGLVIDNVILPIEGHDPSLLLYSLINPSTGLWFIWALAIFCALTKMVFLLPRPMVLGALGIAAVLATLAYAKIVSFENFAFNNLCQYFFFFLLGASRQEDIKALLTERAWQKAGLTAAAFLGIFAITRVDPDRLRPLLGFGLALSGCAFALSLSVIVSGNRLASSVLKYLGANTLPVYVLHVLAIALMSHWIAQMGMSKMFNAALVPAVAVIAVLVSLAIRALVRRAGVVGLYELPRRVVAHLAPLATKPSP
nr:acyltransferase family protein [uncultured Dongia sp.]